MLWAWRTSGPIDPALFDQTTVAAAIWSPTMSIMSILTMSILSVSTPRVGPKVRRLGTPRDRYAQIKRLIVLLRAAVECWVKRSRQRRALYESPNATTITSSRISVFRGKRHFVRQTNRFGGRRSPHSDP